MKTIQSIIVTISCLLLFAAIGQADDDRIFFVKVSKANSIQGQLLK